MEIIVIKSWRCNGYMAEFKSIVVDNKITNPSYQITKIDTGEMMREVKNFSGWGVSNMDYRGYKLLIEFFGEINPRVNTSPWA